MNADSPESPTQTDVAALVLELVRKYGWEDGRDRLRQRIDAERDPQLQGRLRLHAGWLAGERGDAVESMEQYTVAEAQPSLVAWARVGRAFTALAQKQFDQSHTFLDEAIGMATA